MTLLATKAWFSLNCRSKYVSLSTAVIRKREISVAFETFKKLQKGNQFGDH